MLRDSIERVQIRAVPVLFFLFHHIGVASISVTLKHGIMREASKTKERRKKKPRIRLSKVLPETFQTTRAQGAAPITVRGGGEGVVSNSLSEYSMIFHAYRKLRYRPLRSAFLHCVLAATEVSPAFQGQFVLPGASCEQFLAGSQLSYSPPLCETPCDSDPSDALFDRKDIDDIG